MFISYTWWYEMHNLIFLLLNLICIQLFQLKKTIILYLKKVWLIFYELSILLILIQETIFIHNNNEM